MSVSLEGIVMRFLIARVLLFLLLFFLLMVKGITFSFCSYINNYRSTFFKE